MKEFLKKAAFPLAVVIFAAVQTFGMDLARRGSSWTELIGPVFSPDTVIYRNNVFTKFRSERSYAAGDSLDFLSEDAADSLPVLTARDTMKVPDSLRLTDPFRYKYYVALRDSLTHKFIIDSLKAAGDSLDWPRVDSIYYADSTAKAKREFELWYAGLDKAARKRYDADQNLLNHALATAELQMPNAKLRTGLICTGDQFITDRERQNAIKQHFIDGLACDMESAAIAQTCYLQKVPFLSLRVISDTPGRTDDHHQQWAGFLASMCDRSFHFVKHFLETLA